MCFPRHVQQFAASTHPFGDVRTRFCESFEHQTCLQNIARAHKCFWTQFFHRLTLICHSVRLLRKMLLRLHVRPTRNPQPVTCQQRRALRWLCRATQLLQQARHSPKRHPSVQFHLPARRTTNTSQTDFGNKILGVHALILLTTNVFSLCLIPEDHQAAAGASPAFS